MITAFDGAEGLERARNESPDLITLDIMMPEVNGYTICGILKSDERYRTIPIIILTGRDGEMDHCFDPSVAPDAFLNKPFESQKLLSLIGEFLD
ncbi:MAG: response regulator [Candidatus Omnitrophica bacterium]|nr:response regulator [Candidatus Omnitrophota bacterium]